MAIRDEMPLRPGYGTLGKPQVLRANFFAVRVTKRIIYDYEVAFTPAAQARRERKARILQILENHPQFAPYANQVAHDRSQRLVSVVKLPQPLSIQVQYIEEGETVPQNNALVFTVDIKFIRELDNNGMNKYMDGNDQDYDSQPLISALNLILQQHASNTGVRVGRNRYFFSAATQAPLGLSLGIEARRGFFMSIRPTYKQLMVNVNVCMTAFYTPGNLAQAMMAFQQQTGGGMPRTFTDKLKVATTHLGYTRKKAIFRVSDQTARQIKFDCQELGGIVTVEQYFQRKYKITLRHANDLPVVDLGSRAKSNFVPAELCEIYEGQPYYGKLSPNETSNMIRFACNPPAVNAAAIHDEGFPNLGLTAAGPLTPFGISVSDEMEGVPSRILPPPSITYGRGTPTVKDGSWNILEVKFHSGASMARWAVMLVQDGGRNEFRNPGDPDLISFLKMFSQKCSSSGMSVPDAPVIMQTPRLPRLNQDPMRRTALEQIRRTLIEKLNRNSKPSFVLVLLSGVDNYIYPGIKRMCDVDLGIHTVHMLLNKARGEPRKQDQYFSNVALKVNTKLGGVNHMLDPRSMSWLTKTKTMVVGIDVTHPGPNSIRGTPSIAAVVASIDDRFVQFPASLSPQKPDWNKVESLTQMMIERLQLYQKKNGGKLPDRILIYRDGVSEGQYHLVVQEELPRIREAFRKISPQTPYKPKLTITVCGKRHHARFYPADPKDTSRNGNTLPGTVVDKGITDVYGFDYYLQAHQGLQGHVRPTHYFVVYDDFHYDADTLQQGTHVTSYLYARATKAVSLVPPAYYADLACERARFYLNALLNLAAEQSTAGSSGGRRTEEEEKEQVFRSAMQLWGNGIHADLKESMFYI
ncbi:hypothetical protein IEO21_03090 [Rhodonia placenta]|uniref:Piwi-domain-containing protein n=1 Tax=Rhodonia placenta TaxID=104341 RepID=A0A8H7P6F5_9APHY|nr:hypothetical protein IEO21_03090 [Postia placenta]